MQLYLNPTGQANTLNTARINQGLASQSGQSSSQTMRQLERRDSIQIKGKMGSQLESLYKQKMSITEQRGNLVSATLEKGGTMDSIQSQVEAYEEKLKLIEEQINQIMMQELQKKAEKEEPKEGESPKTKEDQEQEQIANMSSIASSLDQAKVIHTAKTQVEGKTKVLQSEIELDKSRGTALHARGSVGKKEEELANLLQKANELTSATMSKLSDVNEKQADIATIEKAPESSTPAEPAQGKESVQGEAADPIQEQAEKTV